MLKRTRQIRTKLKSRKGMSLVELIVGISIIVIVFTATLTAMTSGYTDTLYNADMDRYAAKGGALNEMIMEAVVKQGFTAAEGAGTDGIAGKYFYSSGTASGDYKTGETNAVHSAAKAVAPDIQYVPLANFPSYDKTIDSQYTLDINAERTVTDAKGKKVAIKGIEIKSCVAASRGRLVNTSFVPYSK